MTSYELERVPLCPLCGSTQKRTWDRADSGDKPAGVECVACGFVYMDRRLSDRGVREYYGQYGRNRNQAHPALLEQRRIMYGIDLDYLLRFVAGGRVLDFGAGHGDFVASFPSTFRKSAYDIDGDSVDAGRRAHPDVEFHSSLSELSAAGPWDVIVFRGTIQYQRDLQGLRRFVDTKLVPGGHLIFLATPNADAPLARLGREGWGLHSPYEHLYHFSATTLDRLFNGYRRLDATFPYIGTPYAQPEEDLGKFILACRESQNANYRFPFWGSMMNLVFRRPAA